MPLGNNIKVSGDMLKNKKPINHNGCLRVNTLQHSTLARWVTVTTGPSRQKVDRD